ncbi:MAG TPA: outer membrane beta-barrel protein [bacterium]
MSGNFLRIFILVAFIFPLVAGAENDTPGSIYLVGKARSILLVSGNTQKKYLLISENEPMKVKITGPAVIKVDFRKNIQPKDLQTKEPIVVYIYRENDLYKSIKIVPQDSFTDIYMEASFLPSTANIFEVFVPPGKFTYSFVLSKNSEGGGALYFSVKEISSPPQQGLAPKKPAKKYIKPEAAMIAKKRYANIGGMIGYIGSSGYLSDPVFLIELGYYAPFYTQPLLLTVEGGYYSSSSSVTRSSSVLGELSLDYRLSVIPVTFNILYTAPIKFPVQPYLGGGVGIYASTLNYSYGDPSHGSGTLNDTAFGYNMRLGIIYNLPPGDMLMEYRYLLSLFNSKVSGNVGGSSFLAGYRFVF